MMTGGDDTSYELTLYVNGASDLSAHAIADAKRVCDAHLDNRYQLSVVDIRAEPTAGLHCGVLATPTLVRNSPLPVRKLVGDLSDAGRVLLALELPVAADASIARS